MIVGMACLVCLIMLLFLKCDSKQFELIKNVFSDSDHLGFDLSVQYDRDIESFLHSGNLY